MVEVKRGVAAVMALAALGLVVVVVHSPSAISLKAKPGETIVDVINDKFMARMDARKHAADIQTVKDAAHVNQLFGGSFSDGVGSNTWAHTPWQKYDYKDGARMESLEEVPQEHQELVKCMQLARTFKGEIKANGEKKGHFKVTEAEKIDAVKCAQLVRRFHKGQANKEILEKRAKFDKEKTAEEKEPEESRNEVHLFKPPKEILEKRFKFEKKKEAAAKARKEAAAKAHTQQHLIKVNHFYPRAEKERFAKQAGGVEKKEIQEAKKARKELKLPSFLKDASFSDRQGARPRNTADRVAKLAFWEGIGSEPEKLAPSQDRSKTTFIETDPKPGARKAQLTSALLQQRMTMLLQNPDVNARPYYTADNMGPKSEWSGYGSELASQEQDGGNPYAKGWSKLKMNAGVEGIYQQINQNLEPLAEQYPYMRAIRH